MLFCGSMPRGFASDFYAAMVDQLPTPAMIDASGAALRAAADSKAILLKPNLDEFAQLIGETPAQTLDALPVRRPCGKGNGQNACRFAGGARYAFGAAGSGFLR